MHTNTQTKNGSHMRHRWLVAAPLFALVLTLSVREGLSGSPLSAELTGTGSVMVDADAEARILTLGSALYHLDPGSVLDKAAVPVLQAGIALVFSGEMSRLQAGPFELQGWNGAFQVTVSGDMITIAALSTPVLVKKGELVTMIPAYMQWKGQTLAAQDAGLDAWYRSREVRLLPETFSRERLEIVKTLTALQILNETASHTATLLPPALGQELRFADARDRAESLVRLQGIDALRLAILEGGTAVDSLLLTPDIQSLLASPEGTDALPELLWLAQEEGKSHLFLSFFMTDADRALLAAFHPLIRDHAWVLPQSAPFTDDGRLALLLFTPVSDASVQGLPALAVTQWAARWTEVTQTQSGTALFAAALPVLQEQIHRLDTLQYPQRVDSYASAVLEVATPVEKKLTPEGRHVLADLRVLRAERRLASPIADLPAVASEAGSSSQSSSTHSVSTFAPEILVQQAERAFSAASFMMTAQTALKPVNGLVEVSDIVFGTAKGDMLLRFNYDPTTDLVSAIQEQGQTLPYSITLQAFTEWLRSK